MLNGARAHGGIRYMVCTAVFCMSPVEETKSPWVYLIPGRAEVEVTEQ